MILNIILVVAFKGVKIRYKQIRQLYKLKLDKYK